MDTVFMRGHSIQSSSLRRWDAGITFTVGMQTPHACVENAVVNLVGMVAKLMPAVQCGMQEDELPKDIPELADTHPTRHRRARMLTTINSTHSRYC